MASSDSTQVVRPASGKMPSAEFELQLAVAALSFWEAFKSAHSFLSAIAPQFVAGVEAKAEGKLEDGQPGLTRTVKFGSSAPKGAYVQDKVLKIDEKSHTMVTSEVEGGHLALGFTKFLQISTMEPVADAKTNLKIVFEYEVDENKLKQADADAHLQKTKQMLTALSRLMEEYVIKSSGGGAAASAVQA
ncbi:hypothetical protein Mapa_006209 [Marchantia paleacea]|nr:hypothetical protein Mapa_006209 [Marchantia paleacea]